MGRKLSPYERKEWNRKHSGSRELKTLFKWTDSAAKSAISAGSSIVKMGKAPDAEASRREWTQVGLSKIQIIAAGVIGALLPVALLMDESMNKLSAAFWLLEFFFFAIQFLVVVLIFMVFNKITRPKATAHNKKEPAQPTISEPIKRPSQVPNPTNDPYLKRWNERKPPEIFEMEMPELSFQTQYNFSKVRAFDFGMENNQITFFIDGKNREIAQNDIVQLNQFLAQGTEENPNIPLFQIRRDSVRFEPSELGMDDYTRLYTLPLTPTGKNPKYPLTMKFVLLSNDEHWSASTNGGIEIFGQIWYLQTGEIGKARVICWKYDKKNHRCYIFQIHKGKEGLCLQKIENPAQPY